MTNEQEKQWPLCRAEKVIGSNFEEWCKNLSPELYSKGDCVIAWIVEADLYALPRSSQAIIDSKDKEIADLKKVVDASKSVIGELCKELEAEREKVKLLRNAITQLQEAAYNAYADSSCNHAFELADQVIAVTAPAESKEI